MAKAEITVLVQLRLLPDYVDQGKRDLLDFARKVRLNEPDCAAIEIAQDMDDPTQITMIEKWSNRTVYETTHLQTEHMKEFIERSSRYFDGSAMISFCQATAIGRAKLRPIAPYGR